MEAGRKPCRLADLEEVGCIRFETRISNDSIKSETAESRNYFEKNQNTWAFGVVAYYLLIGAGRNLPPKIM